MSRSLHAVASPATATGLLTFPQRSCPAGSAYCSWGLVLLPLVSLDDFSMYRDVSMVLHVLCVLVDLLPCYLLCHLVVHFRKNVMLLALRYESFYR